MSEKVAQEADRMAEMGEGFPSTTGAAVARMKRHRGRWHDAVRARLGATRGETFRHAIERVVDERDAAIALAKAERAYRLAKCAYMLACADGRPRDAHAAKMAETAAALRAAGGEP